MERHTIVALVLLLAALPAGKADAEDFEILARQTVNSTEPSVLFRLGPGVGRVAARAVRTGGEPFQLRTLEIVFADGERRVIGLNDWLPAGSTSRAVDLGGAPREIDRVVAWKRPSPRPGRAELQLLGIRVSAK